MSMFEHVESQRVMVRNIPFQTVHCPGHYQQHSQLAVIQWKEGWFCTIVHA